MISETALLDQPAPADDQHPAAAGELYPPTPAQIPAPSGFPAPPAACAYHGLAGAIIERLAPNTEADPAAILAQLLVGAGSLIGRHAHYRVEATRHYPNEFCLLIGDTSKSRKGASLDHVIALLTNADPELPQRISAGLSSGEGVVWALRDPQDSDPGITDKRLLVIEPEFAAVLKATARDISTLSPTLRNAWDGRSLQLLTRTAPVRSTGGHLSIIAHITAHELRRHATTNELANGFLNRFIHLAVRRVRLLPEGGDPNPLTHTGLQRFFAATIQHARHAAQVSLDDQARKLWWEVYPTLSEPAAGLAGQLTARAEAHTIRLALIYALLDGQRQIQPAHLKAALALWDYAARSARWALGHTTGDPLAERIHAALRRSPGGLTRTQLRDLLHRNQPTERIDQALATLTAAGKATRQRTATTGRPAETWTATRPAA